MAVSQRLVLLCLVAVVLFAAPATAFGAGNVASISTVEGRNWRHGDIEDVLKTIAFLKGKKWTSMMVKRVYFGNWLRDYSQAVDVGTLKGVQADIIRILVWVLAFMSFGYATGEFEVTAERLGVYRPEEHIDNPKDYADNKDARQYDSRLRPPVTPQELQIDPRTGMKNYIANESGGWATSIGYVKHSLSRCIHYGRLYTSGGSGVQGKDEDLFEALRCLGQSLHCLEDFGAHSNYTELVLRELGFENVFPHTGTATCINLQGRSVFPLVTGSFGAVDFLHSVLGEATDHFTQSEVQQLDGVLGEAANPARGGTSSAGASEVTSLLSIVPGMGPLAREAENLQRSANAQAQSNSQASSGHGLTHPGNQSRSFLGGNQSFAGPPGSVGGPPGPGVPGMSQNFDPVALIQKIYPILEFRDKVVRAISGLIETVPGLESILEKISETITMFVMSLLAPFIRPIINAVSEQLQSGSSLVIDASGKQQYEVWTNPHCSDPTHSLLSKDHFANMLNPPAGAVAASIVRYVAPRVLYAWEHPDIVVDEILHDVTRVFHHPVLRDNSCALHRDMFSAVQEWVHQQPNRGSQLNDRLSSDGVRQGQNLNKDKPEPGHLGGLGGIQALQSGHGGFTKSFLGGSSWGGGASTRELLEEDDGPFRGAMDQDFGYGRTSQPSGGFQGTGYSSHSGAARTESAYHTQQGQYHSEYVGGGGGAYNDTAAAQTSALFGGGPRYNDPVGGSNYGSNANYYGSGGGGGGGQQYGSGDNRQQFGGSGGDYGQTGRRPEERFGETGEQFRPQSGHKHHKKKDSSDDSDGSDGGSGRKEKHKHQHDHKNQHDHKQNKGESYGNEAGYGREAYGRGQNHGGQGYSTGGGSNQPGQQHGGNVPGSFGGEGYGEARYPDDRQAGQEGYYGGGGYNQPPGGGGGGGGGNGGGGGDDDVDEYGQRRQQGYGGGGNNDYGGGSNY